MSENSPSPTILRLSDLSLRRPETFSLAPPPEQRDDLARELGVLAIKKLAFRGSVSQGNDCDVLLKADLGATVVQPCVVTLEPVTTRIDIKVIRRFVSDFPKGQEDEETEMPGDESIEPLRDEVDLTTLMTESLALALPDYPRAQNATLQMAESTPPGVAPITDADINPFAGLAELKKKL